MALICGLSAMRDFNLSATSLPFFGHSHPTDICNWTSVKLAKPNAMRHSANLLTTSLFLSRRLWCRVWSMVLVITRQNSDHHWLCNEWLPALNKVMLSFWIHPPIIMTNRMLLFKAPFNPSVLLLLRRGLSVYGTTWSYVTVSLSTHRLAPLMPQLCFPFSRDHPSQRWLRTRLLILGRRGLWSRPSGDLPHESSK